MEASVSCGGRGQCTQNHAAHFDAWCRGTALTVVVLGKWDPPVEVQQKQHLYSPRPVPTVPTRACGCASVGAGHRPRTEGS